MATQTTDAANLTGEALMAEIDRLRAQNAALQEQADKAKAAGRGKLTLKVSEKGALSVYGLGRFPVTLYREQWVRVIDAADDIRKFMAANQDRLKAKF